MGDGPFGLIEIALAFGCILALAGWELARNRRALKTLRDAEKRGGDDVRS